MTGESDPYRVLGVSRNADATTIRNAFRKLALRHHPDRNPDSEDAEERFKIIVAAYEILTDPALRARWHREAGGSRRQAGFPGETSHHPFRRPGEARPRSRPGHDVELQVDLASEASRESQEITVRYTARQPCKACGGRGGLGEMVHCPHCLGFGRVRPPKGKFYGRDGLAMDCPTCSGTAYVFLTPCRACGGDGLAPMDRTAVVRVPAGIESGETVTVRGAGHAGPRRGVPGRLRVTIVVGD